MTERQENNRIKLYCEPKVKSFITKDWLHMSFWDGVLNLPKILAQLGMAGNTTAYGDTEVLENFSFEDLTESNNENTFYIHFVNSPEKITKIRYFRDGDESQYNCFIPGYGSVYSKDFAIEEKKEGIKKYFFFDICDMTWEIFPRFMKEYHEDGVICFEITDAEYTRVTFKVERAFNCNILFTIVIKNDDNSKLVVDSYKDNILKVLNTEKAKSLITQYEKIRKFIGHITNDYVISCQLSDGTATDELVIADGKTEKFLITSFDRKITMFKTHNWELKYKDITIKYKDDKVSFPETEFFVSDINNIENIITDTQNFINENMAFAFEPNT